MKKSSLFIFVSLVTMCFLIGCGKEDRKAEVEVTTTPEITSTPTPEPTPTPVEDKYVELTDEEIDIYLEYQDIYIKAYEDGTKSENWPTCELIAYYKTIGLDEFILPVLIDYEPEKVKELYGGEWEEVDGEIVNLFPHNDTELGNNWSRGELTVAQIEEALLYGEEEKVFVTNDPSVETEFDGENDYWAVPKMSFAESIGWARYWGDAYVWEDEDGNAIWVIQEVGPY